MKRMNLFIKGLEKKSIQNYYKNDLEDPKLKSTIFVNNNMIEAVNQYILIRNVIQIQYGTYGYIKMYQINYF